jgi:RNA polymerase sigma-70 factor (sigma-E family)
VRETTDQGERTVGEGEEGRLEGLFLRHAESAGRLAFLLTGDRGMAEDLVQDAFIRLAGRFVHLRDEQAFPAYLNRTVVNLARSRFRRARLERAYLRAQRLPAPASGGSDLEDSDRLATALRALPERQRAAVVLRFYLDLSVERTAEIMRCRPGTVKALVFRGLANLRDVIGDG